MSIIQYEKSINSFYEKIFMGMKTCFLNNGNSGTANYGKNIKAVIVGSPGGIMADKFILYCKQHLDGSSNNKTFLDKLLKVSCASGHKSSLEQVLKEPSVIAKLGDIKATQEVALLDKLFFLLNKNTEDIECTTTSVLFGYSSINKAFEAQNYAPTLIKFLLVSDSIFNTDDFAHRKRLVDFVDTLKSSTSAEIVTFSSLHYSGEQLVSMGGMAAILNYPIVGEDEEVGTGERKSEDGRKRTASANQDNANSSEVDHYDTDTDSESVKGTLIT
ncbi:Protein pelota-like protein [Zancudomyces culisetae]|uniref:Protein pelota-like protein n=1 Tax=Zancudomyces culisetae TaxID=1213189 RepID=A0A1R1PXY1_ZANCU|nr:Protein pelota-like protein [Zancudomyces culisetae]|eukprot:OMH85799.1 Protein pelota-like protein [Zancudomyces culisetae]